MKTSHYELCVTADTEGYALHIVGNIAGTISISRVGRMDGYPSIDDAAADGRKLFARRSALERFVNRDTFLTTQVPPEFVDRNVIRTLAFDAKGEPVTLPATERELLDIPPARRSKPQNIPTPNGLPWSLLATAIIKRFPGLFPGKEINAYDADGTHLGVISDLALGNTTASLPIELRRGEEIIAVMAEPDGNSTDSRVEAAQAHNVIPVAIELVEAGHRLIKEHPGTELLPMLAAAAAVVVLAYGKPSVPREEQLAAFIGLVGYYATQAEKAMKR